MRVVSWREQAGVSKGSGFNFRKEISLHHSLFPWGNQNTLACQSVIKAG
jgi:hypothetical protein